jgi:hypothetical protein
MDKVVIEGLNQEQSSESASISERTRALKLIRSLVNIYRLCYGVSSPV